jgi:hypothetical protein
MKGDDCAAEVPVDMEFGEEEDEANPTKKKQGGPIGSKTKKSFVFD